MTWFWKTVLLVTLIIPIMLLVGLTGWYATAQAPKGDGLAGLMAGAPDGEEPIREDIPESRIEELRRKATLAEKRSIERANVIRERLKQSEGIGGAEAKKALRTELRAVVVEAFKARHDLHSAEVASLETQARAMKRQLAEREASYSDIVDRRVEDLLNPDKQWNLKSPAANVPGRETTLTEPSPGDEKQLLVLRSENSVKVEGQFDGNEEVLLVIGDPRFTALAKTTQELQNLKELKWTSPVDKAGEYVIEVRQDVVKIDGGGTAPGLVFQVRNLPNTVQSTSNISFTDKDPLPNGKVVIASPKTKLLLKRKTDQVLVTVGHIELPDASTVPIHILIRRKVKVDQMGVPGVEAALDRKNARSVAEAYLAAALAGRVDEAASLAKGLPGGRDQIVSLPKQLNVQRLAIKSVYLNDPAKPKTALALSEAVTLTRKQPNGQLEGFLGLTLTLSEEGWFVIDIDFESDEGVEGELKRFREANPNAAILPPDLKVSPVIQQEETLPQSKDSQEVQTQQILDRWRTHSESVGTLAVEWKQTVTYSAGSREGKDLRWKDEDGRSFPGKTAEVTNNCRVVIKGGKWRYETIGVQWQSEIEQFAASEDIATSNGTYCVSFVGIDASDRKSPGQAFVYHSVNTRSRAISPEAAPVFMFARPFQVPIGGLLQWGHSLPTVRQLTNDHSIELAYQIPGQSRENEALYRVASDRPWLLRHMSYGRMKLDVNYNVDTDQAPAGWTYTERNPDGAISTIITAKVTSWKENLPVDDEEFTIKLPPGTKVWDRTGLSDVRKYWEAGSDSEPASDTVKNALSLSRLPATDNSTDKSAGSTANQLNKKATGKQLGTVLGKPIHDFDLNTNTSTADNLKRLLFQPLMENYCRKQGLDRADELNAKIKDERNRRIASFFVLPAELNRHLFEKHGGRVILSPFGAVAFDGLKKWLEEREQAGDFEITDPELKAKYRDLWMQEPVGARFASPDQIKEAFDPALTDRFIETFVKREGMIDRGPERLPVDEITRLIDSIKNKTNSATAVKRLRTFTALDFGDGVDRESRQAWLEWWDREKSNIENAAAGVREFTVADRITDPVGNPIAGATVRVHVPFKSSPTGHYQLAHTISDRHGHYVLQFGIPPFATKEELTWQATFTALNPPRFVADADYSKFEKTLHRKLPERDGNGPKYEDDTIFVGLPAAMKFMLRPAVKPKLLDADGKDKPASQPPQKPEDKSPEGTSDANNVQSRAKPDRGPTTQFGIGNVSYSLPLSFPSVESILGSMPEAKARSKNERIQCELVKYQDSNARHYPLVGPAQLVQAHFKSTLTSDAGRDVVCSDTSHLIRAQAEEK